MRERLARNRERCGSIVAAITFANLVLFACAKGSEAIDVSDGSVSDDGGPGRDAIGLPPGDSGGKDTDSTPEESGSCDGKVVINELQTSGASSSEDEFVELYNPSSC